MIYRTLILLAVMSFVSCQRGSTSQEKPPILPAVPPQPEMTDGQDMTAFTKDNCFCCEPQKKTLVEALIAPHKEVCESFCKQEYGEGVRSVFNPEGKAEIICQ